jgi:hypothetical protein
LLQVLVHALNDTWTIQADSKVGMSVDCCAWFVSFRIYEDEKVRVDAGRAAHRSRHRRRRGGRVSRPYPDDLKPVGEFGTWLVDRVREEMAAGTVLEDHLVEIAFPPNRVALTFKSIKSHGCHTTRKWWWK